MSFIQDIVDVTITRDNIGLTYVDLDTILILGDTSEFSEQNTYFVYGSLTEVAQSYDANSAEYKCAALAFGQEIKPKKLIIAQKGTNQQTTFLQLYNDVKLWNDSFYGVIITLPDTRDINTIIVPIAQAVQADSKLFGISTSNQNAKLDNDADTTSVGKALFNLKLSRSFWFYSKGNGLIDNVNMEAAVLGLMLSRPVSDTFAHKTLNGVTPDDLSSTARTNIINKHGNFYINLANTGKTYSGQTCSGEWIDVIRGIDWLQNNIRIAVYNTISSVGKIPYTNDGVAIIESALRTVLKEASNLGILDATTIVITVPDVRNLSQQVRQSRDLPDVRFEARLAGAIHSVKINGTISV